MDLSGPQFTPAIAAFSLKVPYLFLEYIPSRFNFFKDNQYISFISLIGCNVLEDDILVSLAVLDELVNSCKKSAKKHCMFLFTNFLIFLSS